MKICDAGRDFITVTKETAEVWQVTLFLRNACIVLIVADDVGFYT